MAKKVIKVEEDVVLDTLPEEVKEQVVEVSDFEKRHPGATAGVIYE